ncbi:hypothetical protein VB151_13055 [Xanthomonas fragariae]|nr:hypothetical protein [Xanthomonas fragariae]MBL9197474.1 hypothetical protein [Xanthomonas fragariae]MBL9222611.1 hypothetical protein [Xanthomonas fragariae]MDM7555319.1 hypothetical protein [Xanthomonas fragariae]MDM7558439.1 hypothetical protein [Xanthomonas fragariae]MDM7573040.1 hypothetical protein [Xanthomonas fragariae]
MTLTITIPNDKVVAIYVKTGCELMISLCVWTTKRMVRPLIHYVDKGGSFSILQEQRFHNTVVVRYLGRSATVACVDWIDQRIGDHTLIRRTQRIFGIRCTQQIDTPRVP